MTTRKTSRHRFDQAMALLGLPPDVGTVTIAEGSIIATTFTANPTDDGHIPGQTSFTRVAVHDRGPACPECGGPLFYAVNYLVGGIDLGCTEACGVVDVADGDVDLDFVPMPDRLVQQSGGRSYRAVFDKVADPPVTIVDTPTPWVMCEAEHRTNDERFCVLEEGHPGDHLSGEETWT